MFQKFAQKLKDRENAIDAESQELESGAVAVRQSGKKGVIGSPSVDTIYAPAVARAVMDRGSSPTLNKIFKEREMRVADIGKILDQVRIDSVDHDDESEGKQGVQRKRQLPPPPPVNYQEECAAKAKEAGGSIHH